MLSAKCKVGKVWFSPSKCNLELIQGMKMLKVT